MKEPELKVGFLTMWQDTPPKTNSKRFENQWLKDIFMEMVPFLGDVLIWGGWGHPQKKIVSP